MSKEKDKVAKEAPAGDVPLLDEVNTLLEKEKLLLELKFLEQQQMAQEWKTKYDKLVGNVSTQATVTGDFKKLADVVDVEKKIAKVVVEAAADASESVRGALMALGQESTLDLSGLSLDTDSLSLLLKGPTSIQHASANLKIFNFSNCQLDDKSIVALGAVISKPTVMGLDLSNNNLGKAFEMQLLDSLKMRKKSPQYLLLHGNMPLSTAMGGFSQLLAALTDATWGLSLSLADFSPVLQLDSLRADAMRGGKRAPPARGKTHANEDYLKDFSNHPKLCEAFLQAFVCLLDPSEAAKQSKSGQKKMVAAKEKGKAKAAATSDGLQLLTCLGLTHAHMCRQSISLLEKVLRLNSPTLTDLDLSYSYSGYLGALVVKSLLELPSCQLVRLCLKGNAVGDTGAARVGEALATNNSLTYLDLGSNNLSCSGLTSVMSQGLLRNRTMAVLDIRGNAISGEHVGDTNKLMRAHGCCVYIRSSSYMPPLRNSLSVPGSSVSVIYEKPFLKKTAVDANGEAKLYSVDIKHLNAHMKYSAGAPFLIEWSCRPVMATLLSILANASRTDAEAKAEAERFRKSASIGWRVRIVTASGEITAATGVLPVVGTSSQPFSPPDFSTCRAMVHDVPLRGVVEVWVYMEAAVPAKKGGKASDFFFGYEDFSTPASKAAAAPFKIFESTGLRLSFIPPADLPLVGGDSPFFSEEMSNVLGSAFYEPPADLPKGHVVVRAVRFQGSGPQDCTLGFSLQLAVGDVANDARDDDYSLADLQSKTSVGYEFKVLRAIGGDYDIIAEHECIHVDRGESSANGKDSSTAVLAPWMWTHYSVRADGMCCNDALLITGRPTSSGGGSGAYFAKECSLLARDCVLAASSDVFRSSRGAQRGAAGDVVAGGHGHLSACVYAVHNDRTSVALPA